MHMYMQVILKFDFEIASKLAELEMKESVKHLKPVVTKSRAKAAGS